MDAISVATLIAVGTMIWKLSDSLATIRTDLKNIRGDISSLWRKVDGLNTRKGDQGSWQGKSPADERRYQ